MTFFVILISFFAACGNDDDDGDKTPSNVSQDAYYVKYEVENGKQVSYATKTTRKITYLNTSGKVSITVENNAWNGTYGPLSEGIRYI